MTTKRTGTRKLLIDLDILIRKGRNMKIGRKGLEGIKYQGNKTVILVIKLCFFRLNYLWDHRTFQLWNAMPRIRDHF